MNIGQDCWRVFQKLQDDCYLIRLNTSKTDIQIVNQSEIDNLILNGAEIELEQKDQIRDIDSVQGKDKEKITQAEVFVEYLCKKCNYEWSWLLDCHQKHEIIMQLAERFQISELKVRRYIRQYLQGGMKLTSLLSKYCNCGGRGKQRNFTDKRPGKKGVSRIIRNSETIKIFEKMRDRYITTKAKKSYTRLYRDMIADNFAKSRVIGGDCITIPLSLEELPTLRQFVYWIKKNIALSTLLTTRHGEKEVRNKFRPLFSDSIAHLNVKSIGALYEMDEMETDYYLVSRANRNKVIGRAILYLIVDTYSRYIVGCGVGLDNNAWSGAEMALLNMVEDKKAYCSRYGVEIEENQWTVKEVIPQSMIVDNGSEYLSDQFLDLGAATGIQLSFTPPRMGSYKSVVEQKFRQFNNIGTETIPGQIYKEEYGRHHINNARLDIKEFTKCVIQFILYHNNTPMNDYPVTKEMYSEGIVLSPQNIWDFCMKKCNALSRITNLEQYRYSLLAKGNAKLTRSGIVFKKMHYITKDLNWLIDEAYDACCNGINDKNLDIRYDKRNMNLIYFEKNKELTVAWLNSPNNNDVEVFDVKTPIKPKSSNQLYENLSWFEVEEINKTLNEQRRSNYKDRLQNNINTTNKINEIVKEADKKHSGRNEKNEISLNRRIERNSLHSQQYIGLDICTDEIVPKISEVKEQSEQINDKVDESQFSKLSRAEKFKLLAQKNYCNE